MCRSYRFYALLHVTLEPRGASPYGDYLDSSQLTCTPRGILSPGSGTPIHKHDLPSAAIRTSQSATALPIEAPISMTGNSGGSPASNLTAHPIGLLHSTLTSEDASSSATMVDRACAHLCLVAR